MFSQQNLKDLRSQQESERNSITIRMKAIWDNFDKYSTLANLEGLKNYLSPFVNDCVEKVAIFKKDNKKCIDIIQRFDEVLTQKASKISVENIEKKLEEYTTINIFNQFKEDKKEIEREHEQDMQLLDIKIDELRDETKQEFATTVETIAKASKNQLIKDLGGKPVEPAELRSLLKLKADKTELGVLDTHKASKFELEASNQTMKVVHTQLTHMCQILCEYF